MSLKLYAEIQLPYLAPSPILADLSYCVDEACEIARSPRGVLIIEIKQTLVLKRAYRFNVSDSKLCTAPMFFCSRVSSLV